MNTNVILLITLLCLGVFLCEGYWRKLGSGSVQTKNNRPLHIAFAGSSEFVGALKLVYRSGYVGCHSRARSNWGCAPKLGIDKVSGPKDILMIITDENDQVIYPSPRLVEIGKKYPGWYTLPGYTSSSAKLVFTDFGYSKFFEGGDKLKIWYGEDLYGYTEHDNHGSTYMDVYAYIMAI